jgi:hypothetical protein
MRRQKQANELMDMVIPKGSKRLLNSGCDKQVNWFQVVRPYGATMSMPMMRQAVGSTALAM